MGAGEIALAVAGMIAMPAIGALIKYVRMQARVGNLETQMVAVRKRVESTDGWRQKTGSRIEQLEQLRADVKEMRKEQAEGMDELKDGLHRLEIAVAELKVRREASQEHKRSTLPPRG